MELSSLLIIALLDLKCQYKRTLELDIIFGEASKLEEQLLAPAGAG